MNRQPTETLFILNEGPYGNERAYNALRLAMSLTRQSMAISANSEV
jgi:sulfur relay (sulfurtransferase) complex TusBCD TusD component (DsrE family)